MKSKLPPETIIEVVMRKEMTVKQYYNLFGEATKKGWKCQGYQLNYYQSKKKRK